MYAVVSGLRDGEVVSYAEVAAMAGSPGAARAVGSVMERSDGLPWWRVVTATGRLVRGHEQVQARHLRREGVVVRGNCVVGFARARSAGGVDRTPARG